MSEDLIIPIKLDADVRPIHKTAELLISVRLATEKSILRIPIELDGKSHWSIDVPAGDLFKSIEERPSARRAKQA